MLESDALIAKVRRQHGPEVYALQSVSVVLSLKGP